MSNIRVLVMVLLLCLVISLPAQDLSFGLTGGMNIASLRLDVAEGLSPDIERRNLFGAGIVIELDLPGPVVLQTTPMYLQKGADVIQLQEDEPDLNIMLSFIEIPVYAKLSVPSTPVYVLAGPSLGILLTSDADLFFGDIKAESDLKNVTESIDFSLVGGVGVDFPLGIVNVFAEVKYIHGIRDILKGGEVIFKVGNIEGTGDLNPDDEGFTRGFLFSAGIFLPL